MHEWFKVAIPDFSEREECVHLAYVDLCESWNGWVCPYFEKSEVERMNAWLLELGNRLTYDEEADAFITIDDPENCEVFESIDIDGHRLYPIGIGSWIWTLVGMEASFTATSKYCSV